jgi:hypothetical protein
VLQGKISITTGIRSKTEDGFHTAGGLEQSIKMSTGQDIFARRLKKCHVNRSRLSQKESE